MRSVKGRDVTIRLCTVGVRSSSRNCGGISVRGIFKEGSSGGMAFISAMASDFPFGFDTSDSLCVLDARGISRLSLCLCTFAPLPLGKSAVRFMTVLGYVRRSPRESRNVRRRPWLPLPAILKLQFFKHQILKLHFYLMAFRKKFPLRVH